MGGKKNQERAARHKSEACGGKKGRGKGKTPKTEEGGPYFQKREPGWVEIKKTVKNRQNQRIITVDE